LREGGLRPTPGADQRCPSGCRRDKVLVKRKKRVSEATT
jgi:hypothetical protein